MPLPVKDLDEVFENVVNCVKAYYSWTSLDKGKAGFILIAGVQCFRGIVGDEERERIEDHIEEINAEAVAQTGRKKLVEFEGWLEMSQLATWG